jgi:hypothetical protein
MKIKLISTSNIQEMNERVFILQNNLPAIMSQPFWKKKISVEEKIIYIREIASAKMNLWQVINKDYPQTIGNNLIVNSVDIEYDDNLKKQ